MTRGKLLGGAMLVAFLAPALLTGGQRGAAAAPAIRSCIYNAARNNSTIAPTTGSDVVGLGMSRSGNLLLLKHLATGAVTLRNRATGALAAMPANIGVHSGDFRFITTLGGGVLRVLDRQAGTSVDVGTFTLGDALQVHGVSDDGDTVLYSVAAPITRQLRVFDVSAHTTSDLTQVIDGSFAGVSMSADGRRIVAARSVIGSPAQLWLMDRGTATATVIGEQIGGRLSADGGTVVINRVDGTLAVYDVATASLSPLPVPGAQWFSPVIRDVSSDGRFVLLHGWPSGVVSPLGGWAPLVLDRRTNTTTPFMAFGENSPFGMGISDDGNHVFVSDDIVGGWAVAQPYVVDRGASTVFGMTGTLQLERETRVRLIGTNLPTSPAGLVGPAGVSVGSFARLNALSSDVSFDIWSLPLAVTRSVVRMTLTGPTGCRDTVPVGGVIVDGHSGGMSQRVFHPGERTPVFADFAAVNAGPGLTFRKHATPLGDFDLSVAASAPFGRRAVTFTANGGGAIPGGIVQVRSTLGEYHPVVPARLGSRRASAGVALLVPVEGHGEVPTTGVGAVVLNVTATAATAAGRLDVHPAGSAPPARQTASYAPTRPSSSLVVVRPGSGGAIAVALSAGTALVTVEVVGWFSASGIRNTYGDAIDPQPPVRLYDSRQHTTRRPAGSWTTIDLPCLDCAGVVVNITAIAPAADGELLVGGGGAGGIAARPLPTANIRYRAGQTVSNLAIVHSANGMISVGTTAAASFTVDVVGVLRPQSTPDGDVLRMVAPAAPVIDGPSLAGATRTVKVLGIAGVPSRATAVLVRITSSHTARNGYVTAWRAGWTRPVASALSTVPGATVSNLALVQPSADGRIALFSSAASNLSVEVIGYTVPT